MKIQVKVFFDSAHQLPDSENLITKKCANLHGHTYCVIVECEGVNDRSGMVLDFRAIKNIVDELDHQFINDIFKKYPTWSDKPTTAENIACFLKEKIQESYKDLGVKIQVCEGYKGEGSSWVSIGAMEII